MIRKYKISCVSLTILFLISVLCLAAECAAVKPAIKPAAKPKAAKPVPAKTVKVTIPSGPKLLTVVAARAFDTIQATGSPKVSIVLCPEETEPATFSVRYNKPMQGMKVVPLGDFTGPGTISRTYIEVNKVDCDDNLVSCDSVDINAQPTKFWVRVTAPKGTKAGLYKGAVAFYYQNKLFDVVSIEAKVLPLRLIGSSKQYVVYTSYGLAGDDNEKMSSDAYTQFLSGFKKVGFKVVSLNTNMDCCCDAINAYSSVGLNGHPPMLSYAFNRQIPTAEEIDAIETARKAAGCPALSYYCVDLPATADDISIALSQLDVLRDARVETVARVSDEITLRTIESKLDGVCYDITMPYPQSLINGTAKRTSSKWQWYWWDARKSPVYNRLNAGMTLWKSGFDGCMPTWMPVDDKTPTDGVNSITTEALREGIDDTRYVTTYMKALRELKDLKRMKDKDYIASTEAYLADFLSKPSGQMTTLNLSAFRGKMAEFSMKLASML